MWKIVPFLFGTPHFKENTGTLEKFEKRWWVIYKNQNKHNNLGDSKHKVANEGKRIPQKTDLGQDTVHYVISSSTQNVHKCYLLH